MTDLQQRLHALAEDVVPGPVPSDLWERGARRARQRRRRFAAGACAAVVVAALVGFLALPHRTPPAPAVRPGSAPGVPERITIPDSWLGGTDRLGPPGTVAVLGTADRHLSWWRTRPAPFAISAADGSYRFLDLPDLGPVDAGPSGTTPVVLSPDGERVGYAIAGTPSAARWSPLIGVAVYDTRTGRVQRLPLRTAHGLLVNALRFTADSRWLVVEFGQMLSRSSASSRTLAWNLADGSRQDVPAPPNAALDLAGPQGVAWRAGGERVEYDLGTRTRRAHPVRRTDRFGLASPNGERFAGVADLRGTWSSLYVSEGGRQVRSLLGHTRGDRVLGWLDDDRLLAEVNGASPGGNGLLVIDVPADRVAGRITLRGPDAAATTSQITVATDVLHADGLVPGRAPSDGHDPRRLVGGGLAAALALGLGGLGWLRRRRGLR